ncbi:MAG: nucleotide sugar dehydrogenase, partial [Thermodesulfobacteriota bacterium]|nr:nucleotide sugar dehydrogenase [Thermodesulfobacteriota bacterium]
PLYLIETPFVVTNTETAEMIKYASNAFLATKISFINEVANLCEKVGADVHHVAKAMGLDKRIGPKFLHPGPGFGGSCFPKDTRAFSKIAKNFNCQLKIVDAVIEINDFQRKLMVEKIIDLVADIKGKTVGVLGLSFKPNTSDMRESPSIYIIQDLIARGAKIKAYDPAAMEESKKILKSKLISYHKDPYKVAKESDILVFVTEWNEFRNLDLERIKGLLKSPLIVDLRNIYDPHKMRNMGFEYRGIGRD